MNPHEKNKTIYDALVWHQNIDNRMLHRESLELIQTASEHMISTLCFQLDNYQEWLVWLMWNK